MIADDMAAEGQQQWSCRLEVASADVSLMTQAPVPGPISMGRPSLSCSEEPSWPVARQPVADGQQIISRLEDLASSAPEICSDFSRQADSASVGIIAKPDNQQHGAGSGQQRNPAGNDVHADATGQAAPHWQSTRSETAESRAVHPRIVVTSQPLLQATLQGALHHPPSYPQPGSAPLAQPDDLHMPISWPILPALHSQKAQPAVPSASHHLQHVGGQHQPSDAQPFLSGLRKPSEGEMSGSPANDGMSAHSQPSLDHNQTGMAMCTSARDANPSASSFHEPGRRPTSGVHPRGDADLAQAELSGHDALAVSSMQPEPAQHADGAHQQQGSGPRQPLTARSQQEMRSPGDYDHLLPISPISGRRMPGQENAGPGTTISSKQQAPTVSMALPPWYSLSFLFSNSLQADSWEACPCTEHRRIVKQHHLFCGSLACEKWDYGMQMLSLRTLSSYANPFLRPQTMEVSVTTKRWVHSVNLQVCLPQSWGQCNQRIVRWQSETALSRISMFIANEILQKGQAGALSDMHRHLLCHQASGHRNGPTQHLESCQSWGTET